MSVAQPQPLVASPTDGETFTIGNWNIRTRVPAAQTGGAFEIYDLRMGPGSVDYHVHDRMDETLCVLEGTVEFNVNGEKFPGPAGSVAYVPKGLHHGFVNHGPADARVLLLFSPATGQADFFRAIAQIVAGPNPDPAAIKALQAEYDQVLIPLP